ncbi:MAG TPA: gamma-glutamyl-gamma-aminobutyrate hydrolase family protein [Flavisolibacter sp.]|nr:gamma-glutamyl-gamma-aminobutyrate hydrolase family protein [Flavisolibacter sp.]
MKIGLTYTGSDIKHDNYVQWLKGNDNIRIITLSAEANNLFELKDCDGIVLSGGIDIHPKYYGKQMINYANGPDKFNEGRDEFETSVLSLAIENAKPVLGVCRGMQLINCYLGGDLIQDLGGLNKIHRSDGTDKAHEINIHKDTLLYGFVQTDRLVTNSAHHQSINKLGKDLKVNCISDDGVIEGFEWENRLQKPFMLGIQWHPERLKNIGLRDSPLSMAIRKYFIEEIKKSIPEK